MYSYTQGKGYQLSFILFQAKLQNALLNLGQFHHAVNELLKWFDKTEKTLDEIQPVVGDPRVIEIQIAKHRVN